MPDIPSLTAHAFLLGSAALLAWWTIREFRW